MYPKIQLLVIIFLIRIHYFDLFWGTRIAIFGVRADWDERIETGREQQNHSIHEKDVKQPLRVSLSKKSEIPFWFPNQCVHPIIETISFTYHFCGPVDGIAHTYRLFTLSLICCNMLSWLVISSFAKKVPIQPPELQ